MAQPDTNSPQEAVELNSLQQQADSLLELARQTVKDDPEKARTLAKEAVELSILGNYKTGEGTGLSLMCAYERNKGNFAESLKLALQAKACYEVSGGKANLASAYSNIGLAYSNLGNNKLALENYHLALELHEALGNNHGIAGVNNNIGVVYAEVNNYEKALEYYQKALAINEITGNRSFAARNNSNIGVVCRELKKSEEAIRYFEKAVLIHLETGDKAGQALNYGNIAVVCEDMRQYDRALEFSLKALAISEEEGDKAMIAFNASTTGNIYGDLKNFPVALKYLQYSEKVAVETGSLNWQRTAYESLVILYEENEMWKEALEHQRKAEKVKEQLKRIEVEKKAETMEVQKKLTAEEAVRKTTEKILHNILPQSIAERIKNGEEEIIEHFSNCSVLFADVVGFTSWSAKMNVKELAKHLNTIFQLFDDLAEEHEVEKIKTIGDSYMCATGLPEPCADHAERIARMALAMNKKIAEAYPNREIVLRIGIHTGEVVAGVIGKNKYAYDLWGDTANTASRMESHGLPDKIQVTEEFRNLLADKFEFEERGQIEIKGKGLMKTWFLQR